MAEKSRVGRIFFSIILAVLLLIGGVVVTVVFSTGGNDNITVVFYVDDATKIEKQIKKDSKLPRPDDPVIEEGYTFDNWYMNEECTIPYSFDKPVNKNTTIYGKVIANKYWANLYMNIPGQGSVLFDSFEWSYNASFPLPNEEPGRTNYEFWGWSKNPSTFNTVYQPADSVKMELGGINLYAYWRGELRSVSVEYDNARIRDHIITETEYEARYEEEFIVPNIEGIHHVAYIRTFNGYSIQGDSSGRVYAPGETILIKDNIVFIENWQVTTGRITFELHGGSSTELDNLYSYLLTYGIDPNEFLGYITNHRFALPAATRPYFVFRGWSYDEEGITIFPAGTSFSMPSNKITLHAIWAVQQFTVTYSSSGSTGGYVVPVTQNYNTSVEVSGCGFWRDNYEFDRWNTQPDGKGLWYSPGETFILLDDITLYPIWLGKYQAVTYQKEDAIILNNTYLDTLVRYKEYYTVPEKPTSIMYFEFNMEFDGIKVFDSDIVYKPGEKILILGPTRLVFAWVACTNELIFDVGLGDSQTAPASLNFVTGYSFNLPNGEPTRENYTFAGWLYTDNLLVTHTFSAGALFTMPAGTTILTAKWAGDPRTLIYNGNGGKNALNGLTVERTVYFGDIYNIEEVGFLLDYYEFSHWNTQTDGKGISYTVNQEYEIEGNITLFAIYIGQVRTIIFNGNGSESGSVNNLPTRYNVIETLPQNGYARENYNFVGWCQNSNGIGSRIYLEGDGYLANFTGETITLYAIWRGVQIIITPNANEGMGSMNPIIVYFGDTNVRAPINAFYKDYFEFLYWSLDQTDSNPALRYNENQLITLNGIEEIILYAIWDGIEVNVTYVANNGSPATSPGAVKAYYGTIYNIEDVSTLFTYENYEYLSLNTRANGSGITYQINDPIDVRDNITLYIIWQGIQLNVEVDLTDLLINSSPVAAGTYDDIVRYDRAFIMPTFVGNVLNASDNQLTFVGFCLNGITTKTYSMGESATINTNSIITLVWTQNQNYVKFDSNGGSPSRPDMTGAIGAFINLPEAPTRPNYRFVHWLLIDIVSISYNPGDPFQITKSITQFRAIWTPDSRTIIFSGNGNTGGQGVSNINTFFEYTIVMPAGEYTKTNYTFKGWALSQKPAGDEHIYIPGENYTVVTGNSTLTFYAVWEGASLRVQLIGGTGATGGTNGIMTYTTYKYGDTIKLGNVFARANYEFDQWNTFSNGNGTWYAERAEIELTFGDLTLYAFWTGIFQDIVYDANNETTVNDFDSARFGSTYFIKAKPVSFVYENRVFKEWNTLANGKGTSYAPNATITVGKGPIVLYAIWEGEIKYITYNANGATGTMVQGQVRYYEYYTFVIPTFIHNNFVFKEYNTLANGEGVSYIPGQTTPIPVLNSFTVYAIWVGTPKTITFSPNGGSGASIVRTVEYGGNFVAFGEVFTRTNYTLIRWNTQADGRGTDFSLNYNFTNITTDIHLFAVWKGNSRSITLYGNGGLTALGTNNYTINDLEFEGIYNLTNPFVDYPYHTFLYFTAHPSGIGERFYLNTDYIITDPMILYAIWDADEVSITYNGNGGSIGGTTSSFTARVKIGHEFNLWNSTFVKTNYEFNGWLDNFDNTYRVGDLYVAGANTVFTAIWIGEQRTITYNGNGGVYDINPIIIDVRVDDEHPIMSNPFQKTGYSFIRWNTRPNPNEVEPGTSYFVGGPDIKVLDNLILYAIWEANEQDITFDRNDSTVANDIPTGLMGSIKKRYDDPYTIPGSGFNALYYQFSHWATKSDGSGTQYYVGEEIIINGDLILYAIWVPNPLEVRFDKNHIDATGTMSNDNTRLFTAFMMPNNGFTRFKWHFVGWCEFAVPGESTPIYQPGQNYTSGITFNLYVTFYAIWERDVVNIVLKSNYTGGGPDETITGVETYEFYTAGITNPFSRTYWTFIGWNTLSNGNGVMYDQDGKVKNSENYLLVENSEIILYAIWKRNQVTFTFGANGGNGAGLTELVDEGLTEYRFPSATYAGSYTGYTFMGWQLDGSGQIYAASSLWTGSPIIEGRNYLAAWEIKVYVLTFNMNGGSETNIEQPINHFTNSIYFPHGNVAGSKLGYLFAGWGKSSNGPKVYNGDESQSIDEITGDRTYYAIWTPNTYYIEYDSNRIGTGALSGSMSPSTHTYDQPKNLTANGYSLTGWNFVGWATVGYENLDWDSIPDEYKYSNGVEVVNLTSVPNDTITLYAIWEGLRYNVSYNRNKPSNASNNVLSSLSSNADMPTVSHVYDVEKTLSPNTYSLKGWKFAGWTTKADGTGTLFSDGQLVLNLATGEPDDNAVTLYAKWTAITYTVYYDSNKPNNASANIVGSINPNPIVYTYDDNSQNFASYTFTLVGWTAVRWNTDRSGSGITYLPTAKVYNLSDIQDTQITLYLIWTANTTSVTFDGRFNSQDGKISSDSTNWTGSGDSVTKNLTYDSAYTNLGSVPSLNPVTITRKGYTFLGWYATTSGEDKIFETNGTLVSGNVLSGGKNYIINGKWAYSFDSYVTLYARWQANSYKIVYNSNKPSPTNSAISGTTADSNHVYNIAQNLTTNGYSLLGYVFDGWATTSGGNKAYENGQSVVNLAETEGVTVNLYARWNPITYTVKYDSNKISGAPGSSQPVTGTINSETFTYDSPKSLPTSGFSITGWRLTGWNTAANGGGTNFATGATINYQNNLTSTANATVTLYAIWTANTYKVSYNYNKPANATYSGSAGSTAQSTHTYDIASNLTSSGFILTGWQFKGWSDIANGAVVYNLPEPISVLNLTSTHDATVNLFAVWEAYTYIIKFDSNKPNKASKDILGSTNDQTVKFDSAVSLTTNGYDLQGWQFMGWTNSANRYRTWDELVSGNYLRYTDGQSVTNLAALANNTTSVATIYAVWKQRTYTVTFNANGGTISAHPLSYWIGSGASATRQFIYDDSYTGDRLVPYVIGSEIYISRTGYTFNGWYNISTQVFTERGGLSNGTTWTYSSNDIELSASWTAKKYNVTLDARSGSIEAASLTNPTRSWTAGSNITLSNYLEYNTAYTVTNMLPGQTYTKRTGYNFQGWHTDINGGGYKLFDATGALTASVTDYTDASRRWIRDSNVTLYAHWTAGEYTVTFNANGGSIQTATNTHDGISDAGKWTGTGTTATKKFIFDENYTSLSPYTRVVPYQILYATSTPTTALRITRAGYKFAGWYTDGGTLVFNSDGSIDTSNTTFSNSSRQWKHAGDVTLYAQWTAISYTIQYNPCKPVAGLTSPGTGYTNSSSSDVYNSSAGVYNTAYSITNYTYGTGQTLTSSANRFSLTGWSFIGWKGSAIGTTAPYYIGYSTDSITTLPIQTNEIIVPIYAVWTQYTYYVAYNSNKPSTSNGYSVNASGTMSGSMTNSTHIYDRASNLTSNAYTLTGWSFANWNTAENGTGTTYGNGASISTLTNTNGGTVTLYARWTQNTYTVNYDGNRPTTSNGYTYAASATTVGGNTANSNHTYDVSKALTSNGFTVTGWTFIGWATSQTSTTIAYTDGQSVINLTSTVNGSITLYARWRQNTYTVTYNGNNYTGGSTANSEHTYEIAKNLTTNGYTRTGYTFDGWATSSTGSVVYTNGQSVKNLATSGTYTLWAHWKANEYTLTFNGNNGTASPTSQKVTYNTAYTGALVSGSRTGYTLAGWYDTSATTGGSQILDSSGIPIASRGPFNASRQWTNADNYTVWARWTAIIYYVNMYTNAGGYNHYETVTCTYDVTYSRTAPGITGYTFSNWVNYNSRPGVSISGSTVYWTNMTAVAGETYDLDAHYNVNYYTINWQYRTYSDSGYSYTSRASYSFAYGTYVTHSSYVSWPSLTGRTLYSYPSGSFTVTGSTTYYAYYSNDSYTVTSSTSGNQYTCYNYQTFTITWGAPPANSSDWKGTGNCPGVSWYFNENPIRCTIYNTNSGGGSYSIGCTYSTCIAEGTLITLADGSQKAVEDLDGTEMLLVWNFFEGKLDIAPLILTDMHDSGNNDITQLNFSDGTIVKVVWQHGFWDFDLKKYVFIYDDNAEEFLGHWFMKQNCDSDGIISWEKVQLISIDRYQEYVRTYNPITFSHFSYFVNGILSVPADSGCHVNVFEVDIETMQYDQEKMQADIEKYGLYSYEEHFADIIPIELYWAFNGQYIGISIAKGLLTWEYLMKQIGSFYSGQG